MGDAFGVLGWTGLGPHERRPPMPTLSLTPEERIRQRYASRRRSAWRMSPWRVSASGSRGRRSPSGDGRWGRLKGIARHSRRSEPSPSMRRSCVSSVPHLEYLDTCEKGLPCRSSGGLGCLRAGLPCGSTKTHLTGDEGGGGVAIGQTRHGGDRGARGGGEGCSQREKKGSQEGDEDPRANLSWMRSGQRNTDSPDLRNHPSARRSDRSARSAERGAHERLRCMTGLLSL